MAHLLGQAGFLYGSDGVTTTDDGDAALGYMCNGHDDDDDDDDDDEHKNDNDDG